ncbi:hypothetical protein N9D56_01100 [Methylophilaceae bacterium]|nr:hypothetical protein [Methylophilaceae bacterium]
MKKILFLLLMICHSLMADDFLMDKMSLIFVESGSISAKVAFCREYGPKQHNYFIYGNKFQQVNAIATGSVLEDVCNFLYPKQPADACDPFRNYMMQMMWVTYSRYKSQFSDASYDLDKECLNFIDEINNNEIYNEAKQVQKYINDNSSNKDQIFLTSDEELNKIRDLKIKR